MNEFVRFLRRSVIRYQLRSLDSQVKSIVEARSYAFERLMEIRGEQKAKRSELGRCRPTSAGKAVI